MEILKLGLLLLAVLSVLAGSGIYTYNFYQTCDGAVVRGFIGLACVAKANHQKGE